ncbi:DUF5808 domain-containing protein [Pedobacter sp. GSP4]|uniref:DUF5808 domain-containing protein n=1 Tax=Pedobacter sp. GSP4 TaxID=3453716 RepID=UPI003EEEF0BB
MEEKFKHKNAENWKWGIIYFNKSDSRIVVPKRYRWFGWTFNFAHPVSYLLLVLILGALFFLGNRK